MKVLIDCRYLSGRPSGIAGYVRGFVRELPKHMRGGESLTLLRSPRSTESIVSGPCVSELHSTIPANAIRTLVRPSAVYPIGDDLVHIPHNIMGLGMVRPTIVTVHDLMWISHPQYCESAWWTRLGKSFYYQTGIRNALRNAAHILTVSKTSADAIIKYMPETKGRIEVTYNAPSPCFVPASDPEVSRERSIAILGTDAPYFLVVGSNQPSKGHHIALSAFASLRSRKIRLVMTQRRNAGGSLLRVAKQLGVEEQIVWTGAIDEADLVVLMQNALALVQPSYAEGFGMPVLEAAATGCPVIATNIGPFQEILCDDYLAFRPGDKSQLTSHMHRVIESSPLRNELSQAGLRQSSRFSWDDTARKTLDVYRLVHRKG